MFGNRRHARYPINLRLRLQLPGGELETTTEDISLAGFSARCPQLPEEGTSFGFAVHLPDGVTVLGTASAMRVSAEGLSGFSCEFSKDAMPAWEAFVKQEQGSGGLWRMISRYVASGSDDTRAVEEKGRFEALFKREQASAVRLHMVGENGEAYRVAFEKQPSESPEATFANVSPIVQELVKRAASRILSEDLFLRRTPNSPIEPVRVVELKRGGYAYVAHHPNGKPSLMGLQGSEMMVVDVDGESIYPHFTEDELERIAADSFRREMEPSSSSTSSTSVADIQDGFSKKYQHTVVDSRPAAATFEDLRAAMIASQRVQSRTYGPRTLRLFPDVWVYAEQVSAPATPIRGFMVEDGEALCVFVLSGVNAPRVSRLESADFVSIIRDA
ncbi:MAG: PilZ domain-containing protein [Archangium sp.]|nr:PilZ domain-containing protein [Archangium sp.]